MAKSIILGTAQFGLDYGINNSAGKSDKESIFAILEKAYLSGVQILDTAIAYGDAIETIGLFHKKTGKYFEINSKFHGLNAGDVSDELFSYLEKLHVEQIATCFLHTYREYSSSPELVESLLELKKNKIIGKIGVSIYTNEEFETVIDDDSVDVIQFPYNLMDNYYQRSKVMKRAKANGKILQARSVFLQGLFFKDIETLPVSLLPLKPYLQKIHFISAENQLPIEAICLQYMNSHDEIDEIVIGVDTKEQLIRNITQINEKLPLRIKNEIDSIEIKETELLYPNNWNQA